MEEAEAGQELKHQRCREKARVTTGTEPSAPSGMAREAAVSSRTEEKLQPQEDTWPKTGARVPLAKDLAR